MIAVIPARAGSKRVPDKNKKPFLTSRNGLCSLTEWTLIQALLLKRFTNVYISSDDRELLDRCKLLYGRTWKLLDGEHPALHCCKRPDHLATDDASVLTVLYDLSLPTDEVVVLMQPTSPFRRELTFEMVTRRLANSPDGCFVTTATPIPPGFVVHTDQGFVAAAGELSVLTGGWYAYRLDEEHYPITTTRRVVNIRDSIEALDIDTGWDWRLAQIHAQHVLQNENISEYLGFRSEDQDFIERAAGL